MEKKLNELIEIYRQRKEIDSAENLYNLRQNLIDKLLCDKLDTKVSYAEKTIKKWIEIVQENPTNVFTHDIGNNIGNSIFDSLINEKVCESSFCSKKITTVSFDNQIRENILKTLNDMLGLIKEYNCGIENFEKLIITLRDKCNIVGAK